MKSTQILLILTLLSISCGERNVADKSQQEGDSNRIIEELDLPDDYVKTPAEIAEIFGVSPNDILKCGLSFTLDMKSHNWIYRFDDTGRFSHAILLRWSDHGQRPHHPNPRPRVDGEERILEVFRETISNGMLRREHLTRKEAVEELAKIEDYLVGFLGEKTYRFYYQGGKPEEPENENDVDDLSSGDPFANVEPKSAQELRELVNHLNHDAACGIATLIRNYRIIADVEQDGADQPATRSESKPEGNDKPKPESEARAQ